MITYSVSIDVPNLEIAVTFYEAAFGFAKVAEPYPGVAVLRLGKQSICLLEKRPGSKPSPNTEDDRRYERHWTPVHVDFHVPNVKEAVERAVAAGAMVEQSFDHPEHGSAAFCCDPFGHGFCVLQQRE